MNLWKLQALIGCQALQKKKKKRGCQASFSMGDGCYWEVIQSPKHSKNNNNNN